MRRTFYFSIVAVAACLLAGCAQSEPDDASLDVKQLAAETSDYQRAILQDGVVTPGEYEEMLLAHRQCVSDAGADVGELYTIGNNELTFDFEVVADTEAAVEKIDSAADKCMPEFRSEVGAVWAQQLLLSPSEREDIRPKVIECLREAGLNASDDAKFEDIVELMGTVDDLMTLQPCFEAYPGYFTVPAPE